MNKNQKRRERFTVTLPAARELQQSIEQSQPVPYKAPHSVKSLALESGSNRGTTPEDKNWRDSVLHRDGYACVKCGGTECLEADHIQPVALYPELRFNSENGQTLCHSCHVETETFGGKIRRLTAVSVEAQ